MLKKTIEIPSKITGSSCKAYIKELGLLIFLANSNLFERGVIAVWKYKKKVGVL
ncbi:hypothetical protein COO91_07676 [Nostoc flagelliforme CCNUN1]|uniref:Uncharacterized protein n=2 Tax=Nostoc flagelliforme TaxID=1306274 RepID=A0A2K8T1P5_9NOSO|nr:hypothetical protein COO91_07676 [Nostoc flagelliforme CCNUN1]